jgi:hypothetical protein
MSKGQLQYVEFIVALFFFFLVFAFFVKNITGSMDSSGFSTIASEAKRVTEHLVSAGSPEDWNESSVQRIGITDGDARINLTKLSMFKNLSYNQTKSLFNLRSEYFMFLEYSNGTRIQIDGQPGIGKNESDAKRIAKNLRLVIYGNDIVRLGVLIWQKT